MTGKYRSLHVLNASVPRIRGPVGMTYCTVCYTECKGYTVNAILLTVVEDGWNEYIYIYIYIYIFKTDNFSEKGISYYILFTLHCLYH